MSQGQLTIYISLSILDGKIINTYISFFETLIGIKKGMNQVRINGVCVASLASKSIAEQQNSQTQIYAPTYCHKVSF